MLKNTHTPVPGKRLPVLAALPGLRTAIFLAVLLLSPAILADELHGKRYNTLYAEILYTRDEDLERFTVDIGREISFLSESPRKNPTLTRNRVDSLVDTVMKLLGMQLLDLRFTIRLYGKQADLERAYRGFGLSGPAPAAFYSHNRKCIAVSLNKVSDRILAHEIAHAVISSYFIPPPPMRVQEVLAQYVDMHLDQD